MNAMIKFTYYVYDYFKEKDRVKNEEK